MAYHTFSKGPSFEETDLPFETWNQKVASPFLEIDQSMLPYPGDLYNASHPLQLPSQPSVDQPLLGYSAYTHMSFMTHGPRIQDSESPYPNPPSPLYDSSISTTTTCGGCIPSSSVASPESNALPTPKQYHRELQISIQGSFTCDPLYEHGPYEEAPFVTMQSVQGFADPDDHLDEREADYTLFPNNEPQELVPAAIDETEPNGPRPYHHIPNAQADEAMDSDDDAHIDNQNDQLDTIAVRPPKRHRAPTSPPTTQHKITKHPSRRHHPTSTPSRNAKTNSPTNVSPAAYPCPLAPYGCPQSFGAKNEWKRHAYTKHFCLSRWRCDQCPREPTKRPNEFNRKDLFVQHVRRMHPPKPTAPFAAPPKPTKRKATKPKPNSRTAKPRLDNNNKNNPFPSHSHSSVEELLTRTAERCHVLEREAPLRCVCVFCNDVFEGAGCLEARMEHVGRHMEERKREGLEAVEAEGWREDADLERWLLLHKLVVRRKGGFVLSS
ncbi:hypothetical protein Q7P37_009381 [Cladosporium fusiforme]